jgi:predicted NBD/HSP70 family sugar kinase
VSIDIGGTAIKYGVIDENGTILVRGKKPTEASKGGASILQKAVEIVAGYREKYAISGVCISTAGMVDVEKGEIFYSSRLIPNYKGTQFKKVMQEQFGLPCEIENDVNCAGLAETISGAAAGSKITLCLTIGTGIGGCVVIDGEVYHGYSNSACEVGYMHMFDSDFQTLGAASVLSSKVAARKGESGDGWNGYRIFNEAKKGDAICCQAIDEMVEVLGRGIANICYVLNPQTVVLGGGIMAQEEYLYPRLRKALDKYLVPTIAEKTTLKMAAHQNDAGMLGAFYNFRNRRGKA